MVRLTTRTIAGGESRIGLIVMVGMGLVVSRASRTKPAGPGRLRYVWSNAVRIGVAARCGFAGEVSVLWCWRWHRVGSLTRVFARQPVFSGTCCFEYLNEGFRRVAHA